jgi:hypothetical protein
MSNNSYIFLCIKDNFAKGIYPTLQQRKSFIIDAHRYIEEEIKQSTSNQDLSLVVIVAFSFVNPDMRVTFREFYPKSEWILVNTTQDVAEERILARQGHFYKSTGPKDDDESTGAINDTNCDKDNTEKDNSEWLFHPVDFPHTVLDGCDAIDKNALRIIETIKACEEMGLCSDG